MLLRVGDINRDKYYRKELRSRPLDVISKAKENNINIKEPSAKKKD